MTSVLRTSIKLSAYGGLGKTSLFKKPGLGLCTNFLNIQGKFNRGVTLSSNFNMMLKFPATTTWISEISIEFYIRKDMLDFYVLRVKFFFEIGRSTARLIVVNFLTE